MFQCDDVRYVTAPGTGAEILDSTATIRACHQSYVNGDSSQDLVPKPPNEVETLRQELRR